MLLNEGGGGVTLWRMNFPQEKQNPLVVEKEGGRGGEGRGVDDCGL